MQYVKISMAIHKVGFLLPVLLSCFIFKDTLLRFVKYGNYCTKIVTVIKPYLMSQENKYIGDFYQ